MGGWCGVVGAVVGAAVNLRKPTHYVHWGWFQMSVPNLIVIVLMVAVFVLAIVMPFPKGRKS